MAGQNRVRWILAVAVGLALPVLPILLTSQGLAGGPDLSSRLGLASGVGVGTFVVLYLAGVLTSLTPCVYPLIPITMGVFGARKVDQRGRSVALSATYVAGIAVTYSVLGLFAALSGKAFGSALSSPWVAGVMALFMFALAASMFGAFELDLPEGVKSKLSSVGGTGFAPAFLMGLVSGVIAAPCTGPVLAGVLAWVSTQRSVALGFWMLFTYAIGMGTLFFVIGATSVKLPRSGAWMETVKSVLGVLLIAAGAALVLALLPKPGELRFSAVVVAGLAGLLGFLAVFGGALSLSFHGDGREKAQKAAALALLLFAVAFRFGWLGEPRRDHTGAQPVAWIHDENEALALAQKTGKPILIDFFATWCAACVELDKHTFSDPRVQREIADKFVPLKIDATDQSDDVQARIEEIHKRYGVLGMPTVLMVPCKEHQPQPQKVACDVPQEGPRRLTGFEPPDRFLERIRTVQ